MDITAIIRELLFSHDCVIVPGFGGFIGNYTPARIDKGTSTFYPPVKQISFNRNLNHNDGLLAGRISEASGLNYGDARNITGDFVSALVKKLERGERVVFDSIGSFTFNQEGNIQFEPDPGVNYHLDSFGLESFQYPPLEGYDVRKRIASHINREPVRSVSIRKVLWRAAVIIPLLGILVAVPLKTDILKSRIETTNLNPLATAEFEDNRKAIDETAFSLPGSEETGVLPSEEEIVAPNPVEPLSEPAVQSEAGTQPYCLITGSFKSRENAELQVKTLMGGGYSPEIIDAPNGFFRVSAMRCPDLRSALEEKEAMSEKFPGIWVKKI